MNEAAGGPHRSNKSKSTRRLPLDGGNVVDLSRVVAAPTSAKLLAQLGANVVKIDEDPATSQTAFTPPAMHETMSRGKHTIILDLKQAQDHHIFKRILKDADVLVQNFTPSAEQRLGLDEKTVRSIAPDIVYLHLSTYGRRGPWADYKGYAELGNITTGITERSIGGDFPPSGSSASMDYPRWTFTDYAAGVLGAFGALLGLYERAITGRSQIVDTSLVRATALTQILCTGCPEGKAPAVPRGTKVRGWRYSQQLYTTADGDVFVGFSEDRHDTVMSAFGVRHDAKNPTQLLADALARRSSEDVCAIVRAAGGGAAQVTSVAELMAPGGAAEQRGLRLEDTSCIFGRVTMPGPVVRFSSTPMVPGFFPGPFGSDRDAILARLPPD